jgi:hypothetical protein
VGEIELDVAAAQDGARDLVDAMHQAGNAVD